MEELKQEFTQAMYELADMICEKINHNPTRFRQMLAKQGGQKAAKILINKKGVSSTYKKLALEGELDLTLEAQILANKKWHLLFDENELKKCERHLERKRSV